MKTPTWGYVVGILLMLFGGCGGMKNMQYIAMPALVEKQKEMFKAMNEDFKKDTLNTTKADSSTRRYKKSQPSFGNMANTMGNMFSMSDYQKTWVVRFGYIGFVPTFIYILAGVFLLIRRKFSIKLAYGALVLSILFSVIRTMVLSRGGSSFDMVTMSLGVGQIFGIIIDVILIVVIVASDKSAYLSNNLENIVSPLPNQETS